MYQSLTVHKVVPIENLPRHAVSDHILAVTNNYCYEVGMAESPGIYQARVCNASLAVI